MHLILIAVIAVLTGDRFVHLDKLREGGFSAASLPVGEALTSSEALSTLGLDPEPSLKLVKLLSEGKLAGPKTRNDLTDIDTDVYSLTVDEAVSLKMPIPGSIDLKESRRVLVKNFILFSEVEDDSAKIRVGVGIRWILNVKTQQAKADLGFSVLAASAELKQAEVSERFQIIGLAAAVPQVLELSNVPVELNVDNYVKTKTNFDACVKLIQELKGDEKLSASVVGQQLKLASGNASSMARNVAVSWALTKISAGADLQTAIRDFKSKGPDAEQAIRSTYQDVCGPIDLGVKPDAVAIAKAKSLLSGYQLL